MDFLIINRHWNSLGGNTRALVNKMEREVLEMLVYLFRTVPFK